MDFNQAQPPERTDISTDSAMGTSQNYAAVYFDRGEGFSSADKKLYPLLSTRPLSLDVDVDKTVTAMRIVVAESKGCVLKNLEITSNTDPLDYRLENAAPLEDYYFLTANDSRIFINLSALDNTPKQISVHAFIEVIEADSLLSESLMAVQRYVANGYKEESAKGNIDRREAVISNMEREIEILTDEIEILTDEHNKIQKSTFWRLTLPLRKIVNLFKKGGTLISKGVTSVKENGVKKTWEKTKVFLKPYFEREKTTVVKMKMPRKTRKRQKNHVFKDSITFSLLVPLYNTDPKHLKEMISSVQNQTYSQWELCLADGSADSHRYVQTMCLQAAEKDRRIKYKKLDTNLGISGNTNAALEMATGSYLALLDHDDMLHPGALFENMRTIETTKADFIYSDECNFEKSPNKPFNLHYKPDYSPDTLRSYNYITHFSVFSRALQKKIGVFRSEYDGSQDYDMILRLTEQAEKVSHIAKVLYFWRVHPDSVASGIDAKPYAVPAAKHALASHLDRLKRSYEAIEESIAPTTYKIDYSLTNMPLVSIIIPNKDEKETLKICVDSLRALTTYPNYEIIIVENNSVSKEIFDYYKTLQQDERIQVINWEFEFNYSKINNFGVSHAGGEHIILLNNDMEIITPGWIEEMLMFSQREDVGVVGGKLYYPDDTIQHAGVILGIGHVAGHSHRHFARDKYGYFYRAVVVQNLSAVTGACLMVKKKVYHEVGGLNETLQVAFNDIDFCLKTHDKGYLNVFTPYAEMYHYESKSRGKEDTLLKQLRFQEEIKYFSKIWGSVLADGDPYYNKNLTLLREDFSIK